MNDGASARTPGWSPKTRPRRLSHDLRRSPANTRPKSRVEAVRKPPNTRAKARGVLNHASLRAFPPMAARDKPTTRSSPILLTYQAQELEPLRRRPLLRPDRMVRLRGRARSDDPHSRWRAAHLSATRRARDPLRRVTAFGGGTDGAPRETRTPSPAASNPSTHRVRALGL